MPGFKTIGLVVPALLAVAGTSATPFQKRELDLIISQCKHNFAYAFDGGPTSLNTALVNKFDSVGGKTTFFVTGNETSCIYSEENVQALRYGFEHGHQYASNTWSYVDLTTLTEAQVDAEILRLDEAFVKILGVKPKFLTPPYDHIDDGRASYIQTKYNKTIVRWDLASGNTSPGATEAEITDFFTRLAHEGADSKHLTLLHEWNRFTATWNSTVDALHNAKITLLTVAGCLDLEPYERIGSYGERDETWTCDGPWTPTTHPSRSISSRALPSGVTPDEVCEEPSPSSASTDPVPSASSSAPSTMAAPSSVPDGPKEPECVTQNYQSLEDETCSSIETKFALQAGSVSAANTFVDCSDIWVNTNLSICVPTLSNSDSGCTSRERVKDETTCAAVGEAHGVSAGWIMAWNPWLNCGDIWKDTDLCIAH